MSLAGIKRIAAIAETAGNAVVAEPAKPDLCEHLYLILAELLDPRLAPATEDAGELANLCRQARVWAQIVRERIDFTRRAGARASSASIGIAYNTRELLRVLEHIRNRPDDG